MSRHARAAGSPTPHGADRTGLGRLIELTAGTARGDALVTVALAAPCSSVSRRRGPRPRGALPGITMLPFALLAPFVGPVSTGSGRAAAMSWRARCSAAACCASRWPPPSGPATCSRCSSAALGVLVLSKAYNVSRAAIMPSVLPADITLVSANARVALFSLISAGVMVPVAAGLTAWLGSAAVLRTAMVAFLLIGVLAVRLPRHVDSPELEEGRGGRPLRWRTLLNVGPAVAEAVWANVAIRLFSGFLLFFLLFLVQDKGVPWLATPDPFFDIPKTIALLAAAAGLGGLARRGGRVLDPQPLAAAHHAADAGVTGATTIAAAVFFGLWTAVAVALVTAFAQELGKLALDAIVQREIGEEVRSSTFGVVEAVLQLAWVFGGLVGLLLSLAESSAAGLVTLAVALTGTFGWLIVRRPPSGSAPPATANPPAGEPPPGSEGASAGRPTDLDRRAQAAQARVERGRTDGPATLDQAADEPQRLGVEVVGATALSTARSSSRAPRQGACPAGRRSRRRRGA